MTNKHFFKTVLEARDDLDKQINMSTVGMLMGLSLEDNIFFNNKASFEDYFSRVVNLANSLLKMNDHYRKYVRLEGEFISEFRKKSKEGTTDASTSAVSLTTELDGLLSHFKAGLDTLATTFSPLLSIKLSRWEKVDGKSGVKLINCLKNLGGDRLVKAGPLINFLEDNIEWVSNLVDMRDKVPHHGGLKKVTDIYYVLDDDEVIPQGIVHGLDDLEPVRDFMLRTVNEALEYFNKILTESLSISMSGNITIRKNKDHEFPPYQWAIPLSEFKQGSDSPENHQIFPSAF